MSIGGWAGWRVILGQSIKTALNTFKGFEVMRMFCKGQFDIWVRDQGIMGEVRLIHRQFGIYAA